MRTLGPSGEFELLAGGLRSPVTGLTYHDGFLYVSEGGYPARITRLGLDGSQSTVIEGLPGPGNYHTNMALVGPDGWLYFSQGAMTNSGVVGLDAYELGWLRRLPHAHDAPGLEVELVGTNFESEDPLSTTGSRASTGAFLPFGTPSSEGQCIASSVPCTAALMRCRQDGTHLELVAWGLRNAFGFTFLPDGTLLALDQGADDRGSRPIGNAPDALFEVVPGAWYGWPDFVAGKPVTHPSFHPQRGPSPTFLLANHSSLPAPQTPLLTFEPHCAATKLCAVDGELYVALFGDERPMTAPEGPQRGRAVVQVSIRDWSVRPIDTASVKRPIDIVVGRADDSPYVLDFGHFEVLAGGRLDAQPGSGALWKIN